MRHSGYPALLICLSSAWGCFAHGQEAPTTADSGTHALSAREQKKRNKKLSKELGNPYLQWLDEDVPYIISKQEKDAFLKLATNEEREQFIEDFWGRRNPDPESAENTFKEEHYRRIAYANEHFASGVPGWKTDRGHMYILWGPPDEIESYPTGGTYDRPVAEGSGRTSTYPWEKWRYRHLETVGENVEMEFVDPSGSGEYHLTKDPGEKDALAHVPGAGLGTPRSRPASLGEFDALERFVAIQRPPRFQDLDAFVSTRMVRNQIHLDYSLDYLRVTSGSVLVPITLQVANHDLEFRQVQGMRSAALDVYCRISTPTGRVVQTFEDVIARDFPESLYSSSANLTSMYQRAVPLRPGLYRLDVVVKDEGSGNVGTIGTALRVPRYDEEKLEASSLIVADRIESVPAKQIGLGPFVIGSSKVRPRLIREFTTAERMGVFLQFYNLKRDEISHHTNPTVTYRIIQGSTEVWKVMEGRKELNQTGEQVTIERLIPLGLLAPGAYSIEIRATDEVTHESITRTASFIVKAAAGASTPAQTTQQA
jgi:GWxTD domain-containing protein